MKHAIISLNGTVTNEAKMPEKRLEAWIEEHVGMGTFGPFGPMYRPEEVVLQPLVLDEMGNVLQEEVREVRNVEVPNPWQLQIIDLADEIKAQELKKAAKKAAKDSLKDLDWAKIDTVKEMKELVKALVELQKDD